MLEVLLFLGLMGAWLVLQTWFLPKLGVPT